MEDAFGVGVQFFRGEPDVARVEEQGAVERFVQREAVFEAGGEFEVAHVVGVGLVRNTARPQFVGSPAAFVVYPATEVRFGKRYLGGGVAIREGQAEVQAVGQGMVLFPGRNSGNGNS